MNFSDVLSIFSVIPLLDTAWSFLLRCLIWAVNHPFTFIVGDIIFTWAYYLAMCSLRRADKAGDIPKFFRPLAYLLLAGFFVADCIFNLIVGTVVFLQLPRQWLFTERCKQNKNLWDWRRDMAHWWCVNWLNPFDPSGRHC